MERVVFFQFPPLSHGSVVADRRKGDAFEKRIFADLRHTGGDRDSRQRGTSLKHAVFHFGQAFRENNFRQCRTIEKGVGSDRGKTFRQNEFRKAFAIGKCPASDRADFPSDGQIGQGNAGGERFETDVPEISFYGEIFWFIIIFGVLEKQTVNKKRARGSKSSIIN